MIETFNNRISLLARFVLLKKLLFLFTLLNVLNLILLFSGVYKPVHYFNASNEDEPTPTGHLRIHPMYVVAYAAGSILLIFISIYSIFSTYRIDAIFDQEREGTVLFYVNPLYGNREIYKILDFISVEIDEETFEMYAYHRLGVRTRIASFGCDSFLCCKSTYPLYVHMFCDSVNNSFKKINNLNANTEYNNPSIESHIDFNELRVGVNNIGLELIDAVSMRKEADEIEDKILTALRENNIDELKKLMDEVDFDHIGISHAVRSHARNAINKKTDLGESADSPPPYEAPSQKKMIF